MMSEANKINNCNLCGACNLNCPIYAVLLKESAGPRFKTFLAKKKDYKEVFFLCTECGVCIPACPAKIKLECQKIRKQMAEQGIETPANKTMRDNIKMYGNPFGKIQSKNQKIKQYYT
ncbi:MAG: 4Fe-4S dicluster domain-containing protein [Nanoarchaeota archaeon]|nr:4Fe-4S dicluster domain-containing protein [Nanoarchaeota archaeon]